MSAGQVFAWGFLGGATSGVVVFVLPVLANAAINGKLEVTTGRVIGVVAIVVALAAVAGVITLVPHVTSRGEAIGYGLGVNTVIKTIAAAGRDLYAPPGGS